MFQRTFYSNILFSFISIEYYCKLLFSWLVYLFAEKFYFVYLFFYDNCLPQTVCAMNIQMKRKNYALDNFEAILLNQIFFFFLQIENFVLQVNQIVNFVKKNLP